MSNSMFLDNSAVPVSISDNRWRIASAMAVLMNGVRDLICVSYSS